MALPRHFLKACAEAEEATRRHRLAIRQIGDLCVGSRRELAASYALLSQLQLPSGKTPPLSAKRSTGAGE